VTHDDVSTGHWRDPPNLDLVPILAHALDAFYERGYHGTSVRDIARRVKVTVPSLYYHYENKEAILYALLDASMERVTELSLAALAEAGDEPTLRFMNLVECLVLFMARSGKLAFVDTEWRSLGRRIVTPIETNAESSSSC
jgi:AcrR family transcriptional regulator